MTAPAVRCRLCPEDALRSNWIDWLRLGLALLVLFSHCFPLTRGTDVTEPLAILSHGQKTFGSLAVECFFAISGFLLVRSWLHARSMQDYFRRRVLRIHPGFIVALLVSLYVASVACEYPKEYFSAFRWQRFIGGFLTLDYSALEMSVNPFPQNPYISVNGSLWTIQLEFLCYIGVAVYGLFGWFRHRAAWLAFAAAVLGCYLWMAFAGRRISPLWELGGFFVGGATFYLWRDVIPRSRAWLVVALAALVAGLCVPPWFNALMPFAGLYVLFYAAFSPAPDWATGWTCKMDLSYGVYLYAFLVQQSLVHWLHIRQPTVLFAAAVPLTLACAAGSWFLVERPCLRLKSRAFQDHDPVESPALAVPSIMLVPSITPVPASIPSPDRGVISQPTA